MTAINLHDCAHEILAFARMDLLQDYRTTVPLVTGEVSSGKIKLTRPLTAVDAHLITQLWFNYLSDLLSADISSTAAVAGTVSVHAETVS